jgi:hypothetical protein
MADSQPTSKKTDIDWKRYAEDALSLFLATSGAIPTAMRVWTTGWSDWVKSAAETQDQLARRWTSLIRDPGQGGAVLNEMREDVKQYIVEVAGIPERSVLEFLTSVSESAGSSATPSAPAAPGKVGRPSPDGSFDQAIDEFVATATDVLSQLQLTSELLGKPASGGTSTAPAPDYLASLQQRLDALAAAGDKLKRKPSA